MSWNHRVLAEQNGDEVWYAVYEVYYDEESNPNGYGANGVVMGGNQISEIMWQTQMIQKALNKPILSKKNFPERFIKNKE